MKRTVELAPSSAPKRTKRHLNFILDDLLDVLDDLPIDQLAAVHKKAGVILAEYSYNLVTSVYSLLVE
jgi:hypothetical protein